MAYQSCGVFAIWWTRYFVIKRTKLIKSYLLVMRDYDVKLEDIVVRCGYHCAPVHYVAGVSH